MTSHAFILFGHGARDARWKEPFLTVQTLVQNLAPQATVELAFLEMMSPNLLTVAQALAAQGVTTATVIPIFLGQGGHVRNDLPALMAECQALVPQLELRVKPAVGESLEVLQAIAKYCTDK